MIKQITTRQTGILGIMRKASFVRGFTEARKGKPLQYDAYPHDTNQQWDYERGRLFGLMFDGPLKFGKSINRGAAVQFSWAIRDKVIL